MVDPILLAHFLLRAKLARQVLAVIPLINDHLDHLVAAIVLLRHVPRPIKIAASAQLFSLARTIIVHLLIWLPISHV